MKPTKTNKYLYGVNDVPEIPKCIIEERLRLLNNNLELALRENYMTRDNTKVRYILNAIKFWNEINNN